MTAKPKPRGVNMLRKAMKPAASLSACGEKSKNARKRVTAEVTITAPRTSKVMPRILMRMLPSNDPAQAPRGTEGGLEAGGSWRLVGVDGFGDPLALQQARFEATSWKKYSKCPSALAEMRLLKTTAAHETDISSEPKVPEDPPQPQGQDRAASSPAQLA